MKKETALSGSVQEKNGKLYAVIGYGDPITKKRKYKWIGLNLTPDAKKSVVKAALRDAIAAFTEQYEKECRGILSPEDCPFLEFLQSWLVNVKKPNVQKSTYDGYEELIERRIRTFFGDKLTLKDITPVRIQEFYASIPRRRVQGKDGAGVSQSPARCLRMGGAAGDLIIQSV